MPVVAAIYNRALSSDARTRLGNRGYMRDFGKILHANFWRENGNGFIIMDEVIV
jgi:hypothetical protein